MRSRGNCGRRRDRTGRGSGAGRHHPSSGRRPRAVARDATGRAVPVLRQPQQPPGHDGDLVGAVAGAARANPSGRRARLLGQAGAARLHRRQGAARSADRTPARGARRRSARTGDRGAAGRRLADPVPRRHAHRRAPAAALPRRAVPARRGLPAAAARPRLPRHPAPQHAQGRAHPAAAVLHGALRRGDAARGWRITRRFPRTRARRGGGAGMNAQQKLTWVFGAIIALLALASLIGWALQARKGRTEVVANLNARVRAWWGMVAVLAVCFWLGPVANLVVFAFISFFALREFITLTPTRPGDHLPL